MEPWADNRERGRKPSAAKSPNYKPRISTIDNNVINLDLRLTDEESLFFQDLKQTYHLIKNSPAVVAKYTNYLDKSNNPHLLLIKLLYNCQDFHNIKPKSLPMFLMEEFRCNPTKLDPNFKIEAFKVIRKQNINHVTKIFVNIFKMIEDQDMFVATIRQSINNKQYKDACQAATILNLHSQFTVEDFVIPLILQDRPHSWEEFLKNCPTQQAHLIELLDKFLGNESFKEGIREYVRKTEIPDVRMDKIHTKGWKKLIVRVMKTYKLSNELTPNLNKKRHEGTLQFLLNKRFIENSFGDESWKEMVQEAVGTDKDLQLELLICTAQFGEFAEALKWAQFFCIDRTIWPHNLKLFEENRLPQIAMPQPQKEDYHKSPIDDISLVDSVETFQNFIQKLKNVNIVGIDCEWKPSFSGRPSELALMQIATRNHVFVVDIIGLCHEIPQLWLELGTGLFNNCDILKLGFSLSSDLDMIRHALPKMNFNTKQAGFLDLCNLWKCMEKYPSVKLPHEVKQSGFSLSILVHQCLGKPLDKSEQFSNWEKRPLRESQVRYAALDAYCLIQVYDVLKQEFEKVRLQFDDICYNLIQHEKSAKKKPRKRHSTPVQQNVQPPSPILQPIHVQALKVVCDTMLQGLGKNLRRCGIDTAILDNLQDHKECIKRALDDQRYILTKDGPFQVLSGYVPPGHCLNITQDNVDDQLKEVLDYYKVTVEKTDVFSRCMDCNCNSFDRLSKTTVLALYNQLSTAKYGVDDEKSSDDEFYDDDEYPEPETSQPTVRANVAALPLHVINSYNVFYVCKQCGKVYYDGSHFDRILQGRLQSIVQ